MKRKNFAQDASVWDKMAYPLDGGIPMEFSLDRLRVGQQGFVTEINTPNVLTDRLYAFGLVPGTQVYCRYRTPCGSVTALELRGSVVALRTRDMKNILVCQ